MQSSISQFVFQGIVIAASIPVTAFLIRSIYDQYIRNPGEPPLISGIIPYVGCGIEYSKDPWKFLTAARKRYGSVVTLYMGGLRLTFILDPKLYDKVYKTSKKTLDLEHVIEKFEMRLFKMINPPDINQEFNRLHSFLRGTPMTAMSKVFKVQMDKQIVSVYNDIGIEDEDGYKTMGLYEFSRKVFFNASVKMIFGSQFDTDSMYEHFVIFDDGVPDLLSGLPELLLRKYRKAYNEMIGIMKSVSSTTTETDVSEVMLKRNGVMKDFEKSDDFFAQSNFMFLWGSQTNTLPAAFWAFAHVIGSPDLFRKVNEEISKIDQDKLPVPEDLPYLNACISEALRLYSQVFSVRQVLDTYSIATETATYTLRKGDLVNMPVSVPHFDPKLYVPENPTDESCLNFNPERFLVESEKKQPWSFIPFGGGSFMCPGRHLARSEILIFVWRMLVKLDVRFQGDVPHPKITHFGFGFVPPAKEVNIRCKIR